MKSGILTAAVIILVLVLAMVMFVINGKVGGGLTRILGTSEDYQYCEVTKTTANEFNSNLQVKINDGDEARNYYEFHANEGCFKDPSNIELDKQLKCDFFCENENFRVSESIQKRITRFCKSCRG